MENLVRTAALDFQASPPSIIRFEGVRHRRVQDAKSGRLESVVSTKYGLAEDHRIVLVELSVEVKGLSGEAHELAFEARCTIENQVTFPNALQEAILDSPSFTSQLREPLYQRAIVQIQDCVWRMGYNSVGFPPYAPRENTEAPRKEEGVKKVKPRRKTKATSTP